MPGNYVLPKYLRKRKIDLLKRKIICRKFAYLFYRKTVSIVLPSQAGKHYASNLVRKCFFAWQSSWYEATIGWKLALRAQVHYRSKLQRNYLEKWKRYSDAKKIAAVKNQLASLHYEKRWISFKVKICFRKWRFYLEGKKLEKERSKRARNHFKEKHFPWLLKPFFHRWIALVNVARKRKRKSIQAKKMFDKNLLRKTFKILTNYKKEKLKKKARMEKMERHYQKTLLTRCFCAWKLYLMAKINRKTCILLANANFSFSLKRLYFKRLIVNVTRSKFLRAATEAIDKQILKQHFASWLNYVYLRKIEKQQLEFANKFADKLLKRRALQQLKKYAKKRQNKKLSNEIKAKSVIEQLDYAKLKRCFAKLKAYNRHSKLKAGKLLLALQFGNKTALKCCLTYWKAFHFYKQHRKALYKRASDCYDALLIKKCFNNILSHHVKRKLQKSRLAEAKTLYRANLLEEALRVVCLAAVWEKERLFHKNLQRLGKELFLSRKYFRKWTLNTLFKPKVVRKSEDNDYVENEFNYNHRWLPVCMFVPRLFNSGLK